MSTSLRLASADTDLRTSRMSPALLAMDRVRALRPFARRLALASEGGPLRSRTIRLILARRFGVRVGAHSYGPCLSPGAFPTGVTIGRYVSIGPGVRVFRRNHPSDRATMHPYFYNAALGVVDEDTIDSARLWIGHDSWIGAGAIVTPGCTRIGIGAVVGAGAVVTRGSEVPAGDTWVGVPARPISARRSSNSPETGS